jgi:hypothetical protein
LERTEAKQSLVKTTWEKLMDTTSDEILEILEQNAKWWEQAAVTCERTASHLPPGEKEKWQLMGAVYRERAEKHAHLIEQLPHRSNGAHG